MILQIPTTTGIDKTLSFPTEYENESRPIGADTILLNHKIWRKHADTLLEM